MIRIKTLALGILLLFVTLVTGCFYSRPEDIRVFAKPTDVNVTSDTYILQPPDEVQIFCEQAKEVNLQRQRIRPDGKISFEGIGEVDIVGKTPGEVADIIKDKVSALYTLNNDHPVDVRISVFASKLFYVMGQVVRPGPRAYSGRDSLYTALAAAEPNPLAWKSRVQVIRPSADANEPSKIFEVNYAQMIARGDMRKNVLLNEGDIVYVPPTVLASIGMVLEEFITPVARAFYGWYLVQNPPTQSQSYYPGGSYR